MLYFEGFFFYATNASSATTKFAVLQRNTKPESLALNFIWEIKSLIADPRFTTAEGRFAIFDLRTGV